MEGFEIIATGSYLPKKKVDNKVLAKKLHITEDFIYKRTGVSTRYYSDSETIENLAINCVYNLLRKNLHINIDDIDLIIVATTSTNLLMPGISYKIQEEFKVKKCICLDILAGCAGFINAFDIARNYIAIGKINQALVIGVDILSEFLDETDISTSIILSDGAGAIVIRKNEIECKYEMNINSEGEKGDLLINKTAKKIKMNGTEIYKYAVTETVKNIKELLKNSNTDINEIKYIIPHQSNMKIMNSIANRLHITNETMYKNINNVGNTFCASIPIVIDEMFEKKLIQKGDKIILLGYGGGLNTGSILLEV